MPVEKGASCRKIVVPVVFELNYYPKLFNNFDNFFYFTCVLRDSKLAGMREQRNPNRICMPYTSPREKNFRHDCYFPSEPWHIPIPAPYVQILEVMISQYLTMQKLKQVEINATMDKFQAD